MIERKNTVLVDVELSEEDIALLDTIGKSQGFKNRSEVVQAAIKTAHQIVSLSKLMRQ